MRTTWRRDDPFDKWPLPPIDIRYRPIEFEPNPFDDEISRLGEVVAHHTRQLASAVRDHRSDKDLTRLLRNFWTAVKDVQEER